MTTQDFPESQSATNQPFNFQDRRDPNRQRKSNGLERRQFSDGHANLSPEAAEIGRAVDQYKLENHRRFVTYEELLAVIKELGYSKS
jgi:Tfp pilus assembly protein PilP